MLPRINGQTFHLADRAVQQIFEHTPWPVFETVFGGGIIASSSQRIDDLLYLFCMPLADDQRRIIIIDDDQILDADAGDGAAAAVNEDVFRVHQDGIRVPVRRCRRNEVRQAVPASDVAPAADKGQQCDPVFLFHDGIIDRDGRHRIKRGFGQDILIGAGYPFCPTG